MPKIHQTAYKWKVWRIQKRSHKEQIAEDSPDGLQVAGCGGFNRGHTKNRLLKIHQMAYKWQGVEDSTEVTQRTDC